MTPADAKRLEAIKERAANGVVQVVRSDGLSCVVAGFSEDVQFLVEQLEAAQRRLEIVESLLSSRRLTAQESNDE